MKFFKNKKYYKNAAERQTQLQKNYTEVVGNSDSRGKKIEEFINKGIAEKNNRQDEENFLKARKKMEVKKKKKNAKIERKKTQKNFFKFKERQAMRSVLEAQIQQKEMDRENIKREPFRSDDQYRKVK